MAVHSCLLLAFLPDAFSTVKIALWPWHGTPQDAAPQVSWVAGDPNLTLLYGPHVAHPLAACLLGVSFIFCFTMVFMTLLVSLMTTTLQKVRPVDLFSMACCDAVSAGAGWLAGWQEPGVAGRPRQVTQDVEARQLLSKAMVIDELENAAPR